MHTQHTKSMNLENGLVSENLPPFSQLAELYPELRSLESQLARLDMALKVLHQYIKDTTQGVCSHVIFITRVDKDLL